MCAHSSAEKKLFKLREDAVQMQTQIMELSQKQRLQQLQMLSKATMTDEQGPCHYDSISVTDSATQVDFPPLKQDVRDTQVSPVQLQNTKRETSTQTPAPANTVASTPTVDSTVRAHRRTRSEGDSLLYRKKAKDAFTRVKNISRELQEMSLSQHNTDTDKRTSEYLAIHTGRDEDGNSQMMRQCTGCTCTCRAEPLAGNQKADGPTQSHGSTTALHQQVKMLQKKLRAVNKQVRYLAIKSCYLHVCILWMYLSMICMHLYTVCIVECCWCSKTEFDGEFGS